MHLSKSWAGSHLSSSAEGSWSTTGNICSKEKMDRWIDERERRRGGGRKEMLSTVSIICKRSISNKYLLTPPTLKVTVLHPVAP